ncbi:MAG: hypothetical protein HZC54_19740 [Verrucomicrobia bacterium]|nr:hypothetical protein [Verrucomicrobiota bacterium]
MKNQLPRTIHILCRMCALGALLSTAAAATKPASLTPVKLNGELLLFDASQHGLKPVNNYTARWKKGSDLTPVAKQVTKDGKTWIEFAFQGRQGMACSTLFFEKSPKPDVGMCYRGVKLLIECDRDDYPHIGVSVVFSDQSQLVHDLALERGRHEYLVERGFRREKHPPRWELLAHVMLTLDAGRHATNTSYRLRRITMRQVKAEPGANDPNVRVEDRFAEPIVSPQPKQLVWRKEAFEARKAGELFLEKRATERTRRTAEMFAEQYFSYTGRRLPVKTFDAKVPAGGIVVRVGSGARKPQGYTLNVENNRVVITGDDEPGLYYGTVTFFQLLKHALEKPSQPLPVPCAEIVDWPDTPNRLIRLEHPHTFRNYPVRENRGIEFLMDWTDRFVAGNKFNTFYIDFSANIRYARRPEFNGSEKLYSLDDLRRFGQFCRDRFIDLCPAWQIGGHANWWLSIGYHPELREKGWPSQGDVTHPDHDAIVRDCMLDVIEALQPKYLSPKSDEWWHERKEGETPDELLHGRTRAQAFLESHIRLNEWLKPRGITMMIYEDMLSPYHNGKRFDTYKVIEQFPKDIILTLWSSGNTDKEIRYFTERGLRVWPNATGMFTLSDDAKRRVMGFGKGLYSFGNDKTHLLDEYSPLWSLSNLLRVADYAWNFSRDENADPARLVALEHLLALRGNPRAGVRIKPLALDAALTHDFSTFLKNAKPDAYARSERPMKLPTGLCDVAFIPTRLAGGDKDCVVLRKNSKPVTLPVRGRFSSLVFLHTGFVNDPQDKAVAGVRVREWIYGWPCGNYIVHYADGSQATLPVRLTTNIKRLDTASATRSALDVRYTWTLDDANGQSVHLFQWEWVNPRPDVEIVRVVAEHDNILDVSLLLFAISGRDVAAHN